MEPFACIYICPYKFFIYQWPIDGVQDISKLKPQCEKMTLANKWRYNIMFQQVFHKVGESAINCIQIFQDYKALETSVGNSYTEYQLIHTLLDSF